MRSKISKKLVFPVEIVQFLDKKVSKFWFERRKLSKFWFFRSKLFSFGAKKVSKFWFEGNNFGYEVNNVKMLVFPVKIVQFWGKKCHNLSKFWVFRSKLFSFGAKKNVKILV